MEVREENSPPVLKLFGREPIVEDWRYVGRWAYGAAWLSEDRTIARELVRARLSGTAAAATSAAMAAGRGTGERFTLISAIARLHEAVETGEGPFADAIDRAVEEAASQLVRDGNELRSTTNRERTAFAPRFHLGGFTTAMHEVGQDRHVLLREIAVQVNDAINGSSGACPALRVLRLFLQSTLSMETNDTASMFETAAGAGNTLLNSLGILLIADIALTGRRLKAYGSAWGASSRVSGDALSKALCGLTAGSMVANQVPQALADDPWALVFALAMTSEPEHASALLDCGAKAQEERRVFAGREVVRWSSQAVRVDELERRSGIAILAPHEHRQGYRQLSTVTDLDLFTGWHIGRMAEEASKSLRSAAESSIGGEMKRLRDTVTLARIDLDRIRMNREATIEKARAEFEDKQRRDYEENIPKGGESAQRGCTFGFGAGCSVVAMYAVVCAVIGTGGFMGKIAPFVVAIAALPIGAAITVQVAYALRRAAAAAEVARRRSVASEAFEKIRAAADKKASASLTEGRRLLEEAESKLRSFERQVDSEGSAAA